MLYFDKSLICADCSGAFTCSSGDQERYALFGLLDDPRRCPDCRAARKAFRGHTGLASAGPAGREGLPGPMFPVFCADCGKSTQIPFQPRGGRPAFCSDCFSLKR